MTLEESIYNELANLLVTFNPELKSANIKELVQAFGKSYVLKGLTDKDLLELIKKYQLNLPEFSQETLKEQSVLKETLKIIGLMEASEDNKGFEKLYTKRLKKKKKEPVKRELTDFDKLLKALINVPKPKEDKNKG